MTCSVPTIPGTRSRVKHPDFAQTDFFDLLHDISEGSILVSILCVIVVEYMAPKLLLRPFTPPLPPVFHRKATSRTRAPGLWILTIWLALLQIVDDAVLLTTSQEELQHMMIVIAAGLTIGSS